MQKLSSSLSLALRLSSSIHQPSLVRINPFSTSASSPSDSLPSYLVTKCGFSPDKAAEASEILRRRGVRSPDQPDSVISFFKFHGFNDSQLQRLFDQYPWWLSLSVEKFLAPKFQTFRELGFTGEDDVALLVSNNPYVLNKSMEHQVVPMIKLWKCFIRPHSALIKHLRLHRSLLYNSTLEKTVKNATQLRQLSELPSEHDFLMRNKELFSLLTKKYSLPAVLEYLTSTVTTRYLVSKDETILAKVELLKRFGWLENEIHRALEWPAVFACSLKVLKEKLEFFVNEELIYLVANNPKLLTLSLKERLIPRVAVLKALEKKGLIQRDRFIDLLCRTNSSFSCICQCRAFRKAIPEELSRYFGRKS